MKNLKISAKLLVSFGGIVGIIILLGTVSFAGLGSINQMVQLYAEKTLPNTRNLEDIRREMVIIERFLVEAIATVDNKERESLVSQTLATRDMLTNAIDRFNKNTRTAPELMAQYQMRLDAASQYRQQITDILKLPYSVENEERALKIYKNNYVPAYDYAAEALDTVAEKVMELADNQSDEADRISYISRTTIFAVWVVSILFTIWMVFLIRKSILKPVREIEAVVNEMSQGRLNSDIRYESRDEFGTLATGLKESMKILQNYITDINRAMGEMASGNFDLAPSQPFIGDFKRIEESITQMITHVSGTLSQINEIADEVSGEAEQVSSYAQALAQGTEEQASAVQELSASVHEISSHVQRNADDTRKANSMADAAVALIKSSNDEMQALLRSIHEIDSKSQEIRKINKTIEDIAFQTNILALNAAVEAARAGAAGKGFAVVADEVRNLAAKSAEAAQNTTALIESTVTTSAQGLKNTESTAEQLNKAVKSVLAAADIIQGITASSQEQATAVEQITTGLSQVASVVQSNSASSEEGAAASEELSGQAQVLKTLVSHFRLKNIGTAGNAEKPTPRKQMEKTTKNMIHVEFGEKY